MTKSNQSLPQALLQSAFGFPENFIEDVVRSQASKYPPTNVLASADMNELIIELAVAGFKETDISITEEDNRVIVRGKSSANDPRDSGFKYVSREISSREFVKSWVKKASLKIKDASYQNGILRIHIGKDEERVRTIDIRLIE